MRELRRNVPLWVREDEIRTVLALVRQGKHPFSGIEDGEAKAFGRGREAFVGRAEALQACRDRKLIDLSNRLTDAGRKALGIAA